MSQESALKPGEQVVQGSKPGETHQEVIHRVEMLEATCPPHPWTTLVVLSDLHLMTSIRHINANCELMTFKQFV